MSDLTKLGDLLRKLEQGGQLPSLEAAKRTLSAPAEEKSSLCPKCLGNGFYTAEIDDYTDPRFGKAIVCEECDAHERNKRRRSAIMIEKLRYTAGSDARGLYRYHPDDLHEPDLSMRRPLSLDVLSNAYR